MFGIKEALTRVRFTPFSRSSFTYKSNQALQFQSFLPSTFRFSHNSTSPATINADVSHILSFWYDRPFIEWFVPPAGFDNECKDKFSNLAHQARQNELDSWAEEPQSTLALLILLDQFSRNIFRGTPEMYAADPKALDIAAKSIAKNFDKEVSPVQAMTYYLPLVHSENLLGQVAARALYENLVLRLPEDTDEHEMFSKGISSVVEHLKIIEKFGRFPSRNKILGRQSTAAEEEHLKVFPEGFSKPPPESE